MPKPLHPHTHAVMTAARHLDAVAKLLGEGPKFMETPASERERQRANVPPDLARLREHLPAAMYDRLVKAQDGQ